MKIKDLLNQSHETSEKNGYWLDYDNMILKMEDNNFSDSEIETFKNAFINQKLMLISSELSESMESLRKGKKSMINNELINEITNEKDSMFQMKFIHHVKDTFEDELADTFIRLGDLCKKLDIDIDKYIDMKMRYNSIRKDIKKF